MLQTLLAERFKLKVHREMKEVPVYAIVPGNNIVKLPPSTECASRTGGPCGFFNTKVGQMTGLSVSMTLFARALSGFMDRPVVNKTGLDGIFDVTLRWVPDESQFLDLGIAFQPTADSSGPSIFTAVEEQLGLKLQAARAPVEILIIDDAQQPSEN